MIDRINLTLVVQGIHFFIAYIMLDRFLLRPVFFALQQETASKDVLQHMLDHELQKLHALKAEKAAQWLMCKENFQRNIPDTELAYTRIYEQPIILEPILLKKEALDKLSHEVASLLAVKIRSL